MLIKLQYSICGIHQQLNLTEPSDVDSGWQYLFLRCPTFVTALWCLGSSSALAWLDTGHSSTGYLKKSGPLCHVLCGPSSVGFSSLLYFPAFSRHGPSLNSETVMLKDFVNFRCQGQDSFSCLNTFWDVIHTAISQNSLTGVWKLITAHFCCFAKQYYCYGSWRAISHCSQQSSHTYVSGSFWSSRSFHRKQWVIWSNRGILIERNIFLDVSDYSYFFLSKP